MSDSDPSAGPTSSPGPTASPSPRPRPDLADAQAALAALHADLGARFIERDAVVEGMLAALLAGEHVLILGPPGTAKSMLARDLCARIDGARFFTWLLTKFSTPEEVFGPISLQALEHDDYRRITDGKLPTAHVAFLDEIFKASSAILNALLTLMNERVFHNGRGEDPAPLMTLVAASNELPEEGELTALFDRFLLRFVVDYVEEDFRFLQLLALADRDTDAEPPATLSLAALETLRAAVADVELDPAFHSDLVDLRRRLRERHIVPSDRRFRRALRLVRAYALVRGRHTVDETDLEALQHVLWDDPAQREEVRLTIGEVFRGHADEARKVLAQASEVRDFALRPRADAEAQMRASIEAHTKLKNLVAQVDKLLEDARRRKRSVGEIERVALELAEIQRTILERSFPV